jgi:hypothetical protein
MCRICDFLIPKRGEERTEVTLEEINEERRKRSVVVEKLAEEEIKHPCFDRGQNDAIISFYQPRRWYHRFMPTLILSLIAHWKLGVDSNFVPDLRTRYYHGKIQVQDSAVLRRVPMSIDLLPLRQ